MMLSSLHPPPPFFLTLSATPPPLRHAPTPLTPITFRNRTIYIKRDDQLSHFHITGNKCRKLNALLPPAPLHPHDILLSYGGPQSNAMYSLAALANLRQTPFAYITYPLPPPITKTPGNFTRSLALGMAHIQIPTPAFRAAFRDTTIPEAAAAAHSALISARPDLPSDHPLFIPEGAAFPLAEPGIAVLAAELRDQIASLRAAGALALRKPILFLAAGTGTMAYYLAKHLVDVARVVAVPVAGDERYLVKQMRRLHAASAEGGRGFRAAPMPGVLRPRLRGSFADVRPEKLAIWREMCRAAAGEFVFDLIYAPKAWEEVMLAVEEGRVGADGEDLIYYHSGGLEGNDSMLDRFKRQGLL